MRLISVLLVLFACCAVDASDRKSRGRGAWAWSTAAKPVPAVPAAPLPTGAECKDALEQVNAQRKERGLAPFQNDPQLAVAAYAAAKERASRGIQGHLESDFVHLPAGAKADAAGCGALDSTWGFAACCVYDDYKFAGAAWVESGGLRFNHIFVRNDSPAVTSQPATVATVYQSTGSCADGSCGVVRERRGIFRRR